MTATRWLIKPAVFAACLAPAVYLLMGALGLGSISLGADPVKVLLHTCGNWALKFLLITLLMTPLRELTHSIFWLRFRRLFGLFAFFYAVLHFSVYVILDQSGQLSAVWQDIVKRPYITIGMLALLLLIPLALTSTAAMQRRLGRRWTALHRLIYVITILGVWHYWWGVKKTSESRCYMLFSLQYCWAIAFLGGCNGQLTSTPLNPQRKVHHRSATTRSDRRQRIAIAR